MEERISSRKNPLVQQVKKLLTSRAERRKTGLFVGDGVKLLEEAVKYGAELQTVILSEGVEAAVPEGVRIVRIPEDVMVSISPMEAPQGAMFLAKIPACKDTTIFSILQVFCKLFLIFFVCYQTT